MISVNNQGIRKTADEFYKNDISEDLKILLIILI